MKAISLDLRDIGPMAYIRDANATRYEVNTKGYLVGTDKLLTVNGDRSSLVGEFYVALVCPATFGDAVNENCACQPPPESGDDVASAFFTVVVGEAFLRQIADSKFVGIPRLSLEIEAINFGTAAMDYVDFWDVSKSHRSIITSVSAHIANSDEHVITNERPTDPIPDLLRGIVKRLDEVGKIAGWFAGLVVVILALIYYHL